jgi:outer membrane protein assembly factor BamD
MQKILLKLVAAVFVVSLSACGLLPESKDETAGWTASKLYAEAKEELDSGGYDRAINLLEKLESRYPFGTYAQQAQMDIAYAYYRQADTAQALATVDRFVKLYPNHKHVDYMYYLRGLINFGSRTSIFDNLLSQDNTERDPQAVRDSFDSFKLLVDRFPNSTYTPDAILRMKYLVNAMAQYEVHVANYYLRRGAYVSAANRSQAVIKDYPESPATEEALFIMRNAYNALGQTQLRDDTQRIIDKNYPDSKFLAGTGKDKKTSWWQLW